MITGVHHVAAVVRSLEAGLDFWRDTLGLPLLREATIADQGVRAALLACGRAEVELLEPIAADTGVARFLASRGEGLHHLCFESDDIGRELGRLGGTGVELIDPRPRPGLAGLIGFLHPRASGGVLVELATPVEPGPPRSAPLALGTVHVSVDDVRTAALQYQNLFGLSLGLTDPEWSVAQLPAGGVIVQFAATARTKGRPGLSALRLTTPDPEHVVARLDARGIACRRDPTGFVLGPAGAGGVPLIVRQS